MKYDRFAFTYDRWDAEHRSVAGHRRNLVRSLRGKILEIGIGTGLDLPYFALRADVTACDISRAMLRRAAARLATLRHHGVKLLRMDAQKLEFIDDTFDVVVGMFLFCSVDDPRQVAREVRRVLKPGGCFATLGYHTERVVRLLRREKLEIVSTEEWPGGERPIGRILATKPWK